MTNGGPSSWKSRRQDNVSLSTSEAEFVAASQAAQEVVYLRETLKDFGYEQHAATEIYEDNLACIAMSENPVHHHLPPHGIRPAIWANFGKIRPILGEFFNIRPLVGEFPKFAGGVR